MKFLQRACLVTFVVCAAVKAQAGDVAEMIPTSAIAVIRLQAPTQTIKDATAFIDDIQQGFGSFVAGQSGMLGLGISNPTMQGVDQSQDWYAAVFMEKGAEPAVVFMIPAIDAEAMKKAVGEGFTFVSKEGFGIYSDNADAMKIVQAHLAATRPESMADAASDAMKTFVSKGHISAALNLIELKKIYADELEQFKEEMLEAIEEVTEEMPEVPGMQLDWLPGLMETVADKLEVAISDSQSYAVSLTLSPTGVEYQQFVEFQAGSSAASFLDNYPPDAVSYLKKLPANQLGYGMFGASLLQHSDLAFELMGQMFELDEDQAKHLNDAMAMLRTIDFGNSVVSFGLGDLESGLIRYSTAAEVKPAAKIRDLTDKMAQALDGLELPGMTQHMSLEKNYEKVNGVDVDLLVVDQELGDDPDLGGIQQQMNQIMYGADGPQTRIAYLDGAVLQSVGGGTAGMQTAMTAYQSEAAGQDSVILRDLKPLGENNNLLGMFDLQTLIVEGLKIAVESPELPPMPFDKESLDGLEVQRAYIGFAVRTADNGVVENIHIPKQTLQAGMQLFGFFQQIQQQNNAF